MAEAIHLPKIGMTMEDAVLTRWLVPDGATVSAGDSIFEMDIEKVLQDVEAEASGVLRYLVGDCVRLRPGAVVGCVLAAGESEVPASLVEQAAAQWSEPAEEYRTVGSTPVVPSVAGAAAASGGGAAAAPAEAGPAASSGAPTAATGTSGDGGQVPASPSQRRRARQLGVDLTSIRGTGTDGRISDADIENAAAALAAASNGGGGAATGGRVVSSPAARRLASELGVEIGSVAGTGPNGRIVEADVRAAAEAAAAAAPVGATAAPAEAAPTSEAAPEGAGVPSEAAPGAGGIAYSGRRRTIGERMAQSLRESAQLTLSVEVRVDDAMRMASGLSREWRADRTVVTLTSLVIRAAARALVEHPRLNARLDEGRIVEQASVNVGFAADVDEGLMVPVIRDAAERPLQEVAAAFVELSRKASANELTGEDVTDGTFTVTSLESFEVDAFTPIINPPQAAILGVGRVRRVPVAGEEEIELGQVTTLSLTIDHRVVDGAPAARFLGRVGQLLDRPYLLM